VSPSASIFRPAGLQLHATFRPPVFTHFICKDFPFLYELTTMPHLNGGFTYILYKFSKKKCFFWCETWSFHGDEASPWRWKKYGYPKRWYPTISLHDVTTLKTPT